MIKAVGGRESEHQLWPVVGPLLAFCMLLVVLFRAGSVPLGLPLMTLAGIVLCHVWKWRGVAISSVCLAAVSSYYLYQQPSSLWMWTTALSLCIVSIFVVTVLCFEEFSLRWERLCKSAQDHRQTIVHLNEQIHSERQSLLDDQGMLQQKIEALAQDVKGKEEKIASNERLAQLAHDELLAGYAHQEKILQELYRARQQHATMSIALEEMQDRVSEEGVKRREARYEEALIEIQQLKPAIEKSAEDILQLQLALQNSTEEVQHLQMVLQKSWDETQQLRMSFNASVEEIERLQNDLQEMTTREHLSNERGNEFLSELTRLRQDQQKASEYEEKLYESTEAHQAVVEELNAHIERISEEKRQVESVLSSLQERVVAEQERYQVLEKKALDDARQMQSTCAQLLAENAHLAQEMEQERKGREEAVAREVLEVKDREVRRIEGLYQQLRQQFTEKTDVLAATRRELFSTQEKLASLQKEVEESMICEGREVDISLQKLLEEAESELESAAAEHAAEIARLHEVIDSLMTCEKRA